MDKERVGSLFYHCPPGNLPLPCLPFLDDSLLDRIMCLSVSPQHGRKNPVRNLSQLAPCGIVYLKVAHSTGPGRPGEGWMSQCHCHCLIKYVFLGPCVGCIWGQSRVLMYKVDRRLSENAQPSPHSVVEWSLVWGKVASQLVGRSTTLLLETPWPPEPADRLGEVVT